MKAHISYGQLLDLLLAAESMAKRLYDEIGMPDDLDTAELAYQLRQEMLDTDSFYFELKDADPFERPFEIKWELNYD